MDLSKFKYTGPGSELPNSRGIKRKLSQTWDGPLPPILRPGLKCVFVGFNPGTESAKKGHYYAHPSNRFWKYLLKSGMVDRPVTFDDDIRMPGMYNFGFTDLVARTTKGITQLNRQEMAEGVESLDHRLSEVAPENICLIGKGIWEAIAKARNWSCKNFEYGQQTNQFGGATVWVLPSTSGLNSMSPEKQISYWEKVKHGVSSSSSTSSSPSPTLPQTP